MSQNHEQNLCLNPNRDTNPSTSRNPNHSHEQSQSQATQTDIEAIVRNSREITEFQRKVYLELLKVPAGETISYGELAHRIGCRSARAIGQAMRRNPFAPAVPCHRVIRADGTPGGYGGSTSPASVGRKLDLIASEKH